MFPLTEFPIYEVEQAYGFTNPLAIEFGFWGFLIWVFYFLTTCYFCIIEPRLKIFEIPWVKLLNNIIIIATCAFTGFLFFQYLPELRGRHHTIFPVCTGVALVVLAAVYSSTDIRYVKILSLSSTWLFFALIAAMWAFRGIGLKRLGYKPLPDRRLLRQYPSLRSAFLRLPRVLSVLVVCLEHHDRAVRCSLRRWAPNMAAAARALADTLHTNLSMVFGIVWRL